MTTAPTPPYVAAEGVSGGSVAFSKRESAVPVETVATAHVLCDATPAEVSLFGRLIEACVGEDDWPRPPIGQRRLLHPLLEHSGLPLGRDGQTVSESATAVLGGRWLAGFALLGNLAVHLRRGADQLTRARAKKQVFASWSDATLLALTAEVLARVTGRSTSHTAFVSGLLLGALGATRQVQSGSGSSRSGGRGMAATQPISNLELTRLLSALGCIERLTVPNGVRDNRGCWCVVAAALEFGDELFVSSWPRNCLQRVPISPCPPPVHNVLMRHLKVIHRISGRLAETSWNLRT